MLHFLDNVSSVKWLEMKLILCIEASGIDRGILFALYFRGGSEYSTCLRIPYCTPIASEPIPDAELEPGHRQS